jgi:hypothetical protein
MEKIVTISTKPYPAHEDGITQGVQSGFLFRNNPELEELYKQGYRINSYAPDTNLSSQYGTVKVYLVK